MFLQDKYSNFVRMDRPSSSIIGRTYVQLSRHYHVDRHTIAEINKGNRYVKFLNELGYTKFPLRKIQ